MERVYALLEDAPELPADQIYRMIDHASRVDKSSFKILAILLATIAIVASTARLIFRHRSEHKFHIEDWLILFATILLITETGLVYDFTQNLYFIDAATTQLPVLKFISTDPSLTSKLLNTGPSTLTAYFTLGWLAIFAIKYSFLALFHKMLRNVTKKLKVYFWVVVAATTVAGIVVVLESFILCPHFGADAAQCFLNDNYTFSLSTGIVVQSLDIITDLMIISIPIVLLQMTSLRFCNKLRIALVLCLSILSIILSIARLAGGLYRNVFGNLQFGVAWISFMLHCEAAVAVLAGSVPALRAVYQSHQQRKAEASNAEGDITRTDTLKSKLVDSLRLKGFRENMSPDEITHSTAEPVSRANTMKSKVAESFRLNNLRRKFSHGDLNPPFPGPPPPPSQQEQISRADTFASRVAGSLRLPDMLPKFSRNASSPNQTYPYSADRYPGPTPSPIRDISAETTLRSRVIDSLRLKELKHKISHHDEENPPITRARHSLLALRHMPMRQLSRAKRAISIPPERRSNSVDSADSIIHPGLAYHAFRRHERNDSRHQQQHEIRVTYECKVESEKYQGPDLDEATSQTGTVLSAPTSPQIVQSPRFIMEEQLGKQFGQISSGLHA